MLSRRTRRPRRREFGEQLNLSKEHDSTGVSTNHPMGQLIVHSTCESDVGENLVKKLVDIERRDTPQFFAAFNDDVVVPAVIDFDVGPGKIFGVSEGRQDVARSADL